MHQTRRPSSDSLPRSTSHSRDTFAPSQVVATALGAPYMDAPWNYDLSVDEHGNMCDGNIYVYSYEQNRMYDDMIEGSECSLVYDRDGSQGHLRSYGPYDGTNVSMSVMRAGEGCVPH